MAVGFLCCGGQNGKDHRVGNHIPGQSCLFLAETPSFLGNKFRRLSDFVALTLIFDLLASWDGVDASRAAAAAPTGDDRRTAATDISFPTMHPPKLRRLAVPLTRAAGENRARLPEPLGWATAPRSSKHDVRRFSTTETTSNSGDTLRKAKTKVESWVKVPSISAVAGAVALVPVVGGAWLVTEYVIRQRLCEHHLQQVCDVFVTCQRT